MVNKDNLVRVVNSEIFKLNHFEQFVFFQFLKKKKFIFQSSVGITEALPKLYPLLLRRPSYS